MSSLDSPSFTKLYKQYRLRLISRINRLIGCRETASDLAQEAYMRLLDNRDLSNVLNLSAYLFQIGHNLAVDYQRDPLNKIEYLLLDEAQPCPLPQLQEIVSLRQQCSILIDAIATMPQGCRDVFLLRKIDGLSYREISIRLNISEKTVQRRLVQAMLHCHRSV
ncbi:putative RNA polymerase sigma factor FecI [Nitrosomonas stercoris]|uniref:Putative RNA polymerase sigma factor FecI n=1 Tax=Nitrosomonas stercoris TaxID=1444684 RepID=A0A4Y1YLS6_9PROT|nr:putative RNA polymerase sigma factor FecI [Nitrosomonas stercoris]